jgi:hypothetical protein
MTTRNRAFAPLSAILMCSFSISVVSEPATAAAVAFTNFRGAWVPTTSYGAGAVVTYNGASYFSLVANTGIKPSSNSVDWAILDAPGTLADVFGNTADGIGALSVITGGGTNSNGNTAYGFNALNKNTTGSNNTASGANALLNNTTGTSNTASGLGALYSNTTGVSNTAFGISALSNNTTGGYNVAVGYLAGYNLTTGSNNIDLWNVGVAAESGTIRIGTVGTHTNAYFAGIKTSLTTDVSALPVVVDTVTGQLGTGSLVMGPVGPQGVPGATGAKGTTGATGAMGPAGTNGTVGPTGASGSTGPAGPPGATGPQGLPGLSGSTGSQGPVGPAGVLTDANDNTNAGLNALIGISGGANNSAFGTRAMQSNQIGSRNTAVGQESLFADSNGWDNSALGFRALFNTTGNRNTAIGWGAGENYTTGSYNISIGNPGVAGESNTIRIGDPAAAGGPAASQTAAFIAGIVGNDLSATGVPVVVTASGQLGTGALLTGPAGLQGPQGPQGVPGSAGPQGPQGSQGVPGSSGPAGPAGLNGAMGPAGPPGQTGAMGLQGAMGVQGVQGATGATGPSGVLSDANGNTFGGTSAPNITGIGNTAFGQSALPNDTTGGNNQAFGESALQNNSTGNGNSAFGTASLQANTTGVGNAAFGGALNFNTTGSFNIGIGQNSGYLLTTGDYNIDIGNYGVADEGHTIRIGDPKNQTFVFIAGINNQTVAGAAVLVDPNTGQLGVISSSRRFKEDIQPMANTSDRLLQLRPVQFRYKKPDTKGEKPIQYGLIAEEVAEVFPELVVLNKDGQPETVAYHLLPAMLLNELQKEHAQNQLHTQQLTAQEKLIHDQEDKIAMLQAQAAEVHSLKARLADVERVTALLAKMNGGDWLTVQAVAQRAVDSGQTTVAAR